MQVHVHFTRIHASAAKAAATQEKQNPNEAVFLSKKKPLYTNHTSWKKSIVGHVPYVGDTRALHVVDGK